MLLSIAPFDLSHRRRLSHLQPEFASHRPLDHHIERLAEDHANALRLADQLGRISQVTIKLDEIETNMVFMRLPKGSAGPLRNYLSERGIILGSGEPTIRLVTHLDIGVGAVDQLATEINNFFS